MTQLQVEIVNPRAGRLLRQSDTVPPPDDAEVSASTEPLPKGFHPMLVGKIPFSLYGRMKICGDIISPIDEEWEAMK